MDLSASNIGWRAEQDAEVYLLMQKYGYKGLEIAPTRIFTKEPYGKLEQAAIWADTLKRKEGFVVSSMQSIWFGRQERIFGTEKERNILINYTKKAVDFAVAVGCRNLVFGCPGNRSVLQCTNTDIGIRFFRTIGEYAALKGVVIAMEANPPIYHTNYINDTASALKLIELVGSSGFLLNLDVGTMIQNNESTELLRGNVNRIHHVHISEPGLKMIERRELHRHLRDILMKENYQHYVSVEVARVESMQTIEDALAYVREFFG